MFTKQSFKQAFVVILLSSLIGVLATLFSAVTVERAQAQAGVCGPADLVTVDKGTGVFKCQGQDFRFVGVNMRALPHFAEIFINSSEFQNLDQAGLVLYNQLKAANDMGVKVIRVFLPREDKNSANHNEFIDRLKSIMDFATDPGYAYDGSKPYSLPRPAGPVPAPNMKFLVALTDSIYDPGRGGINSTLQGDRAAYVLDSSLGLEFLRGDWYTSTGATPNYTTVYRSYVENVVDAFKLDNRIFAWELGNEMFTNNLSDMVAFVTDMVSVIKDCTSTKPKCDPNHMVTTGFISTGHAIHAAPSPSDIAAIYSISKLDFGSIHGYNNQWTSPPCVGTCPDSYNYADVDFHWFQTNDYPYIVGELGFSGANPGNPAYPEGMWGTTPMYNTTNDRGPNIHNSINRFFDEFEADGIFQWAFLAGDRAPEDGNRGMDGQVPATGRHQDWTTLYQIYQCRANILAAGSSPDIYIKGINVANVSGSNAQSITVDMRNNNSAPVNVSINYSVVDASGASLFNASGSASNMPGGDSASVGSVTWTPTTTGQYTITAVIQSSSEPAVNTCNNAFTRTLLITVSPTISGAGFFDGNEIHVVGLPLGVNASLDRTREGTLTTATLPLASSPTLNAAAASIWEELIAFLVNLLPTYDYYDTQIDGVSTYCYRARTYFLGIPLATSNEVCLAPVQTPYPHGIQSVTTEPASYNGTRDLPALFDGITEHPNYGIINFTPGPIGVILTFPQPVTLDAFVTAIGGQTGNPLGYRWRIEADLTGSGVYEVIVAEQFSDAELVNIPFPSPVTAVAFRIIHERFTGDGVEHIREITPIFYTDASGSLSGGVFVDSATPANAVANALVQACVIGGRCRVSTTNSAGQYIVDGLAAGSYLVTAFPPADSVMRPEKIGPLTLSSGQALSAPDILLRSPEPPPPGTTITSRDTTPEGIPVVYWAESLILRTTGCVGSSARYAITQDGIVKRSGSLIEGPAGTYTAEIAPLQPVHGVANIVITLTCPGGSTQERHFDVYIDPSGVVRTIAGEPIVGATVTLYHADSLTGTFEIVPDGSSIMSPMNRTNPDTTDLAGHFGWDVLAGYYKVRAAYPGCVSPENAAQPYVESAVLIIPPPVTDLDLRLSCGETIPPNITATLSPEPNGNGWNHQDVTLTLSASDNEGGSGVREIAYSASGAQTIDPTTVTGTSTSILVTTEGQTILTYLATDNAGNSSLPQTVTVQLDKTAPAILIASPLPQIYTHTGLLNIAWTVTDTLSGVLDSSGLLDGSVVTHGQTIDLLSLALGAHTVVVTATDTAGNIAQQTSSFTVTANIDSLIRAVQQSCLTGAITRQEACVALKATLRVAQELIQRERYPLARQVLQAFNAALSAFFQRQWINQPTYELLLTDALFVINALPQ